MEKIVSLHAKTEVKRSSKTKKQADRPGPQGQRFNAEEMFCLSADQQTFI
jgi:hypothetical protein